MNKKTPQDITKIEDIPDIDRTTDEETFVELEAMAQNLGLEELDEENSSILEDDHVSQTESSFEDDNTHGDFSDFVQSDQGQDEEDYDFEEKTSFFNEDPPPLQSDEASSLSKPIESPNFTQVETNLAPIEEFTSKSTYIQEDHLQNKSHQHQKTSLSSSIKEEKKPEENWTGPENFSDVTSFMEMTSFGDISAEGNPPFSLILKHIKYEEDVTEILQILKDHHIITDETQETAETNLNRGQFLISRVSEFSAIYLCHKLRKFDLEILMGLTEEINPPKSYQSNDKGLTSKKSLLNNKLTHKQLKQYSSEIITSTLTQIDGHSIHKVLGAITHTKIIPNKDFVETRDGEQKKLAAHYDALLKELIQKVDNEQVNGILGINFTTAPVHIHEQEDQGPEYQIICSGNMVCLRKN